MNNGWRRIMLGIAVVGMAAVLWNPWLQVIQIILGLALMNGI